MGAKRGLSVFAVLVFLFVIALVTSDLGTTSIDQSKTESSKSHTPKSKRSSTSSGRTASSRSGSHGTSSGPSHGGSNNHGGVGGTSAPGVFKPPSHPTSTVYVPPPPPVHIASVPANIASGSSCVSSLPEVSGQLQAFINTVPNNYTIQFGRNRCYRIEYGLEINSRQSLVFDGNGATLRAFTDGCAGTRVAKNSFTNCKYTAPSNLPGNAKKAWPQSRFHVSILDSQNITIKNLHIVGGMQKTGYDADYAFQAGIKIRYRTNGVLIDHVSIDRVGGDYIYMQGADYREGRVAPTNVTIQNNNFGMSSPKYGGALRQEIAIDDAVNVHFQYNHIQHGSRAAVDIEPTQNSAALRDIFFDHNVFGHQGLMFFANHNYGDADPVIDGVYFRWNTLNGTNMAIDSIVEGPAIQHINANDPSTFRRRNYQFIGNVSNTVRGVGNCDTPNTAMRFWGINGLIFKDNVQPMQANRCIYMVDMSRMRSSQIINNSLKDAAAIAKRYLSSTAYCERGNRIGPSLTVAAQNAVPVCP